MLKLWELEPSKIAGCYIEYWGREEGEGEGAGKTGSNQMVITS